MFDTIQKLKYRASAGVAQAQEELNSRLNDRMELPLPGLHGEKLYLTGGGLRGTLFAVYEFLEACLGCRFYSSDFEKIPHLDTIELDPIDDRQVPVFTVRDNFWADYNHHKDFAFKRKIRL